jgi:putative hemolysin
MLLELAIIFFLICLNGLLAMAEMSIVSARKTRIKNLAERGQRRAKAALLLIADPTLCLSTVQIGITMVGILAGAFGGSTIALRFNTVLKELPIPGIERYSEGISVTIVVISITYLSLVIGELVPKQLALRYADTLAIFVARPMLALSKFSYPIAFLLTQSSNSILRLFGSEPTREPTITEDEIKLIIRQAAEAGVVKTAEQNMIYGVLRLGDLQANDLMTPRHEMIMIDINHDLDENIKLMLQEGHSFYPVYEKDISNIIGFLSVKALYKVIAEKKPFSIRNLLIPPLMIPEKSSALKILERFKASKSHIALVLDEHGGFEGIVSIKDLVTGIVGEIPSFDSGQDEPAIIERDDGSWLVEGGMSAMELKEFLGLKKLPQEGSGYTTVGGMIMAKLGRVPKAGESFRFRGFKFEVVDMDRLRVDKILVSKVISIPKKNSADSTPSS